MSRRPSPGPHARGRPRSQKARRVVLDAALDLFEKGGYPAATIEAIAGRSGVAKTTIYRWWPNRAALLMELLQEIATAAAPLPEGRDPLRALRTELDRVAEASDSLPGRLLMTLLGESQHDPALRTALMRGFFDPRRRATAAAVRAAQAAGLMRKGVPPLIAVDLLYGPLFYRRFLRQERVSRGFAGPVFASLLKGLAPGPVTARRRARAARARRPARG